MGLWYSVEDRCLRLALDDGSVLLAAAWWKALAGLPKLDGSLWHAYRRKWVTQRKHLPDADVAECGGWRGTETLKECYQMPDPDTMQSVIEGARNLGRER